MDIKSVLDESGVRLSEFAVLCGVSRVSVHSWCSGKKIHVLRQPKVEKLLTAIDSATSAKDLPIDRQAVRGVGKDVVTDMIKSIVLKHLASGVKSR